MRSLKNESGQALLLVMMVMMVLLLIGSAALTRTSNSHKRSFEQKKIVQASYIAEAGIDKALAAIKNDPYWLKGLTCNSVNNYIPSLVYNEENNGIRSFNYAGGQITSVKITRTSTGDNPTTFYLESQGDYQGATRTIKVKGEMYDPIDFAKGIWVRKASVFSNNAEFDCDIFAESSLTFSNNTYVSGTVKAVGDINLENNETSKTVKINMDGIVTGGNLNVSQKVEVLTSVEAAYNISLAENALITGSANSYQGNINLANNSEIIGDVFYNYQLNKGSGAVTGNEYFNLAHPVMIDKPTFPVLEESLYSQYPLPPTLETLSEKNYQLSGDLTVDGIYYIPGNLNISGTYSGNGLLVTSGKVTITDDLIHNVDDTYASLAIVAFGKDIYGIGIEAQNNAKIFALLYSPNIIFLANGLTFYGSLVCDQVGIKNNAKVTYDPVLDASQPKWPTTVIKIKSWKENFSIF